MQKARLALALITLTAKVWIVDQFAGPGSLLYQLRSRLLKLKARLLRVRILELRSRFRSELDNLPEYMTEFETRTEEGSATKGGARANTLPD